MTLRVLVAPRSSRTRIGPVVGDRIKISIKEPPVDGKANRAVVALLARVLGVPRQQLEIVSGSTSKRKTVRIEGVTAQEVLELLRDSDPC